MRLHALTLTKINELDGLQGDTAEDLAKEAVQLSKEPRGTTRSIKINHRDLSYTVGRWWGWEGPVWMVEDRTGIIYRGTISDVSEFLALCSEAHYNPNGTN